MPAGPDKNFDYRHVVNHRLKMCWTDLRTNAHIRPGTIVHSTGC